MPDEPDNPPTARQTAMQVAQCALALAQAVDTDLIDIRPVITQLRADLTDTNAGLTTVRQELNTITPSGDALTMAEDHVAEIATTNVTAALGNIVARLEAAERGVASLEARPTTYAAPEDMRIPDMVSDLEVIMDRLDIVERRLSTIGAIDEGSYAPDPEVIGALQVRVTAMEEKLANPLRFDLDGEQVGRIIERLRGLVVADLGGMPVAEPVGKVHGKVLALMRTVTNIGKEHKADMGEGGRFKFRGVDDAMDAVGHAMREVGLTLETKLISQEFTQNPVTVPGRNGGSRTVVWTTAHVVVRYIFVCPEDGSKHTFEMAGEGRDASDKATSKAVSMAIKYGLFQALMIPVTGLDDSDNENPQVAHDNPPAQTDQPVSERPAASDQATRQQRARDALAALRALDRLPAAEARARLTSIREHVEREQLGNVEVDGATLRAHGAATARTLPAEPAPPTEDDPPWNP